MLARDGRLQRTGLSTKAPTLSDPGGHRPLQLNWVYAKTGAGSQSRLVALFHMMMGRS